MHARPTLYHLSHSPSPGLRFELSFSHLLGRKYIALATVPTLICVRYFQDRVFVNYLLGRALNHNPPDLYLPNSQDYRCEPGAPGFF
jgi:hypothetical protein